MVNSLDEWLWSSWFCLVGHTESPSWLSTDALLLQFANCRLIHNLTTLQAETPEQWCEEIIRLYNDKNLWLRIAQNQQVLAQDKYSFTSGKQKMQHVFASVGLL